MLCTLSFTEVKQAVGHFAERHNLTVCHENTSHGMRFLLFKNTLPEPAQPLFSVTIYATGEVIGQPETRAASLLQELAGRCAENILKTHPFQSWIGTDEAGKGDLFGPLTVAAVHVSREVLAKLILTGVRDSKKMTPARIQKCSAEVKQLAEHSVVTISPVKYNELYAVMKNVNRLLAWAHARALENVLQKAPCDGVISDQFAPDHVLEAALLEKGKKIRILQKTGGEKDVAVAAASVLAREAYLTGLSKLSRKTGFSLPGGSAAEASSAAQKVFHEKDIDFLKSVCKVHFKNIRNLE